MNTAIHADNKSIKSGELHEMIADLEEAHKKRIEEIINGMNCPKDFLCYKSSFTNLCQAKDIGIESFVECFEKLSRKCSFALPFAKIHLCQCPLRVFLVKELKK
jgi:hypothetical protein